MGRAAGRGNKVRGARADGKPMVGIRFGNGAEEPGWRRPRRGNGQGCCGWRLRKTGQNTPPAQGILRPWRPSLQC